MKRAITLVFGLLAMLAAGSAHSATQCTAGLITNYYAIEMSGTTSLGQFCAATGIMVFRASGEVELTMELSCDGATQNWTSTGTYTVAKTCMGEASIPFVQFGTDLNFDISVAEGGNYLMLVGNLLSAEASFQGSGRKL